MRTALAAAATLALACLCLAEDPKPESCKGCTGQKYNRCSTCNGEGSVKLTCIRCDGAAKSDCGFCQGKGWVPCTGCSDGFRGAGTCKKCHGDQKVGCEHCVKGKTPCPECEGKGKVKMTCPACDGTRRTECLRCLDWASAILQQKYPATPAGEKRLEEFVVPENGMTKLTAALKRAITGKTQYLMDKMNEPKLGLWKDQPAIFVTSLVQRPPESARDDMDIKLRGLISGRNKALLGDAMKDISKMTETVWAQDWPSTAKYIVVAVVQAKEGQDGLHWRPVAAYAMPTEKITATMEAGAKEFDASKMCDWSFVDPRFRY